MTFAGLSTLALIAAALFAAGAVVTLYLLRRTPRARVVSNIDFWRRAAERSRPRSPFATRVPWLALLVSLSIALLLVGEMGDPRAGGALSGATVIVLAADRTMATVDSRGRHRIDDAVAIARQTAQRSTVHGQVAIVRAGVHAEVVTPLTRRAADAERALAAVETDDGTADLNAAVSLARSIVRASGSGGRVVVVADRDDMVRGGDDIAVTVAPVGTPGDTVANPAFDARRDPGALGEYHLRCEVRAYTAHRSRAHLVVRDRDTVITEETLTLEPGELRVHVARGFSSAQSELAARLEDVVIEGSRDMLARDDAAWAALAPVVATRVLLVTAGDRYLESALAANPAVALDTVDGAGLDARRSALARYQAVVLDRIAPQPMIDHPSILFVGVAGAHGLALGAELTGPRVTAFASEHRVLAGLRFDQIQIARARALVPDADDRVLVRSDRHALAVARDRGGVRSVALGFDTDSTDLVRRVAFPLFVHNTIVWLDRREREHRAWQAPGDPLRVPGAHALVLTPAGDGRDVRGALYDTGRAGLYRSADRAIAVSAADEASALHSVDARADGSLAVTPGRASLATLIAGAILALLCAEWLLTLRGRLP